MLSILISAFVIIKFLNGIATVSAFFCGVFMGGCVEESDHVAPKDVQLERFVLSISVTGDV